MNTRCRKTALGRPLHVCTGVGVHRRRAGPGKSVAVGLAARLADLTNRAIGEHYGIGAAAVGANRSRLAGRPDVLQIVENLGRQLQKKKVK